MHTLVSESNICDVIYSDVTSIIFIVINSKTQIFTTQVFTARVHQGIAENIVLVNLLQSISKFGSMFKMPLLHFMNICLSHFNT